MPYCAYRQTFNIWHLSRQSNSWSLRCSWSIAGRRCSNYIFVLDLTPSFNGLGNDNRETRRKSSKFLDLLRRILNTLRYIMASVRFTLWWRHDNVTCTDAYRMIPYFLEKQHGVILLKLTSNRLQRNTHMCEWCVWLLGRTLCIY